MKKFLLRLLYVPLFLVSLPIVFLHTTISRPIWWLFTGSKRKQDSYINDVCKITGIEKLEKILDL